MAKRTSQQTNRPRSTPSQDLSPTDDLDTLIDGGEIRDDAEPASLATSDNVNGREGASVRKRKRTADIVAADTSRVRVTLTLTGEAYRRLSIHEITASIKPGTYVSRLILANAPDYVITKRSATNAQLHELDTSEGLSVA